MRCEVQHSCACHSKQLHVNSIHVHGVLVAQEQLGWSTEREIE